MEKSASFSKKTIPPLYKVMMSFEIYIATFNIYTYMAIVIVITQSESGVGIKLH